jgi:hypothetical protein
LTGPGIGFWSEFFLNKNNNGHSSIHFIQNLMLNSNLKLDIQKSILVKRLKTKKGQTEFDRVPTLLTKIRFFSKIYLIYFLSLTLVNLMSLITLNMLIEYVKKKNFNSYNS